MRADDQRLSKFTTEERTALEHARSARYRQTEKYQTVQERFKATKRRSITSTRRHAWIKENRPEQYRAWMYVGWAIRTGRLVKPTACQSCERAVWLDAHHHLGYAEEHRLDVVFLCRRCHKAAHTEKGGDANE
jgi:hypothetical protein